MKYCKIVLALLLFGLTSACSPGFKRAYKNYNQRQLPEARAGFERYQAHPKLAASARFYLAKIKLSSTRELPELLALDRSLVQTDSLFRLLPGRIAQRQTRRYQVDTNALQDLREQTQRWAIAWTRVRGTLPALDSLLDGLPQPLPSLQPEIASTRQEIVNRNLETTDYDTMTLLLRRHIEYVLPENYEHTRRMSDQVWTAFTEKYSPCELDRFAREHPLSFAGRDCWLAAVQPLLCTGTLAELLEFHTSNPWTALEIVLLNRIADLAESEPGSLRPALQQHLADLQARQVLRQQLRASSTGADTIALLDQALRYIGRYAPRYSAFRLMEECLQYFLNGRNFTSAIDLLERSRPYFPDTLPAACTTNFDFQLRVRPWIDGKLPILQRPTHQPSWHPLTPLNSRAGFEYSPVLRADGRELFFAAKNRPENVAGADVFTAQWDSLKQQWSAPSLVAELSGMGQQMPLSITADGLQLLLFWNARLYLSRRTTVVSPWNAPEPLPVSGIPIMGKGFLSADGTTLVLEGAYSVGSATQAPDLDLFVSFLDPVSKEWSRPTALGATVNTDGQEASPWLSADGRTLYYTSTGYPGLGSSDVFRTQRADGENWTRWTRPENLGKDLNNTFPHPGFTTVSPDGTKAWLGIEGDLWEVQF